MAPTKKEFENGNAASPPCGQDVDEKEIRNRRHGGNSETEDIFEQTAGHPEPSEKTGGRRDAFKYQPIDTEKLGDPGQGERKAQGARERREEAWPGKRQQRANFQKRKPTAVRWLTVQLYRPGSCHCTARPVKNKNDRSRCSSGGEAHPSCCKTLMKKLHAS